MKNYIYVKHTQWSVEVYYCRANKRDNAIYKLGHLSNTNIHQWHYIDKEMKELSHCEEVLNIDKKDYKG